MQSRRDTIELLREMLGPEQKPSGTGAVMTGGSTLQTDLATMVAAEMNLDKVCRDLGTVLGSALADAMEQKMLRPAEYAGLEALPENMVARMKKALDGPGREIFADALIQVLRMRG